MAVHATLFTIHGMNCKSMAYQAKSRSLDRGASAIARASRPRGPPGLTQGGERAGERPVLKETLRDTGKKPSGEGCPPPNRIID